MSRKLPWETWVYLGARMNGARRCAAFQRKEGDALKGEPFFFAKTRSTRRCFPGGVYRVRARGKQAILSTLTYLEEWHDRRQRARWEAESDAADVTYRTRLLEKRATLNPAMQEALQPLQELYRKLRWDGKRALESIVLAYLRD